MDAYILAIFVVSVIGIYFLGVWISLFIAGLHSSRNKATFWEKDLAFFWPILILWALIDKIIGLLCVGCKTLPSPIRSFFSRIFNTAMFFFSIIFCPFKIGNRIRHAKGKMRRG